MLQRIAQLFGRRSRRIRSIFCLNAVVSGPPSGFSPHQWGNGFSRPHADDMPAAIFQLLNKRAGNTTVPTTSTLPPPFRAERCPFLRRCVGTGQSARYPALLRANPPVNLDSGLRIFDRGPFQPGPFFTSFRRTFVSRATCDADCDMRMKQRG